MQTFTANSSGERLDVFLSKQCPEISRSKAQHLISENQVTIDGATAKPSLRLKIGQSILLSTPKPVQDHIEPQHIALTIVYQDCEILLVDKPAGLTVHPGPGHQDQTLVNAVLALCPELRSVGGNMRPGIVHRLDKDTSGLIVIAKNERTHAELTSQLAKRKFKKLYIALAHGKIYPNEAMIDAPIGRDPNNRKRMAIVTNGRVSTTRYRVLRYYKEYSLVEVELVTGRTHQIRVHFASLGHPLVGDVVYGRSRSYLNRHFLHAKILGFQHPATGKYLEFSADMPDELVSFLTSLNV